MLPAHRLAAGAIRCSSPFFTQGSDFHMWGMNHGRPEPHLLWSIAMLCVLDVPADSRKAIVLVRRNVP